MFLHLEGKDKTVFKRNGKKNTNPKELKENTLEKRVEK